jgi:SNF2 family DNA or RNA helicase
LKTFGTLKLDRGSWTLDVEPHVAIRAKRCFASLSKKVQGTLRISDTIENCRDLVWFLERYPLEVEQDLLKRLEARAEQQRDRETLVDSLLRGLQPSQPFELAVPAREYQKVAASVVLASGGLLIADDVGLGKTASAICVLTDPRARPALVVTLTHLQRQWQDEIRKFAPQLTTHILQKGTPYDYTLARQKTGAQLPLVQPHPDVLITNYHKLDGWSETLSANGLLKSVVFDEVHELRAGPKTKNSGSKKCTAALQIARKVAYRTGLSATPIFNYGGEVYNVISAVRPGSLGGKTEFKEEWCDGGMDGKARLKNPEAFGSFARSTGLMLRRTRKDVGRELPDLVKVSHHVESDAGALELINSSATELAKIILAQADRELGRGEAFRAGGELDAMIRQATGIAKAPYVAEFVNMLLESGEKVVLFGWHRAVYDIWLERLRDHKPALYTGSESENQKEAAKKAFCNGETNLLVISLRSGAGLDGLQYSGCRTVVFGELDWSPAVHEQSAGRVHRDGQDDAVVAYYLISDSGADPIIADVLGVKRAQLEGIRDPDGPTGLERLDVGGAHIKRLAEELLRKKAA